VRFPAVISAINIAMTGMTNAAAGARRDWEALLPNNGLGVTRGFRSALRDPRHTVPQRNVIASKTMDRLLHE
jgi:hypothetical protein